MPVDSQNLFGKRRRSETHFTSERQEWDKIWQSLAPHLLVRRRWTVQASCSRFGWYTSLGPGCAGLHQYDGNTSFFSSTETILSQVRRMRSA